jgi:multidrug transporter EmrE-like cation transporter
MSKLLIGIIFATLGQIMSFLQMQGNVKYGWYEKYPIILLLTAIPSTWFYVKSVDNFVQAFDGQLWPSRLIGFGIGIIIFVTMSMILFKEPITIKTLVCLILACTILCIQIFWK